MTPKFNWECSKFGYILKLLKTLIPHLPSSHSPHQPRSLTNPPAIPHTNHDPSPTLQPFPTPTTVPHQPSSHSPQQPRFLADPPSIPHTNHDPSLTLHPFPTPTTIPHLPSIHSPPRFHTHSSLPLIQPLHSISSLHSQYLH